MYFGFENISIRYGEKKIVNDITIDFPKGKTTTIIGANGCGKTSLLKTISRAVNPETGKVVFKNMPLDHYRPKELAKKIAYLPQMHYSPSDINVRTLISYGRYPYRKFGKGLSEQDNEVINNTIDLTGLSHLQDRTLNNLSGGERQRAWIAMTICQEPEILILDEPITYLDIGYQLEVMELIKALGQKLNITIIMVLHDINLAARYSHHLFSIKDKSIYACGEPRHVITEEKLLAIFNIKSQIYEDQRNTCPFIIPEKR